MNSLLENHTNDVEQVQMFTEKLKKIINEKQKQPGESLSKIESSFFEKGKISIGTFD